MKVEFIGRRQEEIVAENTLKSTLESMEELKARVII